MKTFKRKKIKSLIPPPLSTRFRQHTHTKTKVKTFPTAQKKKLDSLDDVSVLYIFFPAYTSKSFKVYQQYTYSYEKWEIEIDTGPFIFDAIQFYPEIVDIPVKKKNMK